MEGRKCLFNDALNTFFNNYMASDYIWFATKFDKISNHSSIRDLGYVLRSGSGLGLVLGSKLGLGLVLVLESKLGLGLK